jgi:hypothetical protein
MPDGGGMIFSEFCCPRVSEGFNMVESKTTTIEGMYLLIAKHFDFDIRTTSL